MRNAGSHFDFDLDLAVQQSNDNPVFYVQYAYARICSIYRELEERGIAIPGIEEFDVSLITDQTEINLAKTISKFPEEVEKSAEELAPHRMGYYATELAEAFHSFYNSQRILGVDEPVMKSRILLMESAKITLKNVLRLLGVSSPEKM